MYVSHTICMPCPPQPWHITTPPVPHGPQPIAPAAPQAVHAAPDGERRPEPAQAAHGDRPLPPHAGHDVLPRPLHSLQESIFSVE